MVSTPALRMMAGLPIQGVAQAHSARFGKPLASWDLGQLYKGRGVAKKQPQPKLGGPKPKSEEVQDRAIKELQDELAGWQ